MKKHLLATALAVLAAGTANATTFFGVDEENNLVTFTSANPGTYLSSVAITASSGATMLALDIRPLNGVLYGLGDDRVLYSINRTTGAATAVGGPLAITGSNFGFDFNPTIDRIRVVSNDNTNYVVNPITGALQLQATNVFYNAGDVNAGLDPDVTASAYTPSVFGAAAGTTQLYGIDNKNDVLVRQANNAGTLDTVGGIGVNFGPRDSFDIDRFGTGYVIDNTRLYSINLQTGALTSLGNTSGTVYGLTAAVPEPATWAMMIAGFGLVGGAARRARRVKVALA
jgi:hypothetical protein